MKPAMHDIIVRVEGVRKYLGLNKSRFSSEIGMKPQTYNNFIGSQGSKPNVELIHGVVTRFNVGGQWLLTGQGEMLVFPSPVVGEAPGQRELTHGSVPIGDWDALLAEYARHGLGVPGQPGTSRKELKLVVSLDRTQQLRIIPEPDGSGEFRVQFV